MVVKVSTQREYIPEWNNNKNDPNPIRVIHKAPDITLRELLIPKPTIVMKTGQDGVEGGEMEVVIDHSKVVKAMTISIQNLTIEMTDENGVPTPRVIINADELMAKGVPAAFYGLVEELGNYYQKILQQREVNEKN